jgi:hypothetical protein
MTIVPHFPDDGRTLSPGGWPALIQIKPAKQAPGVGLAIPAALLLIVLLRREFGGTSVMKNAQPTE